MTERAAPDSPRELAAPAGAIASGRIRRLGETLANQIAAGEVVERPASVLKELLENALDAGATRIEVDLRGGGVALVRVRDNGVGVVRDDLPLALERHATSKIASFDDLVAVRSLGFRGEALPSIASVSRLEIDSRAVGSDLGWRMRVEGGSARDPEPSSHPVGTTVAVRDLFFNTPARRKFLRTERTELRHLDEVARRSAIANPRVAFTVRHENRALLSVPAALDASGELRRLATLCGREFARAAREVALAATGLSLRGWIAGPGGDRAHADLQHFFVNGRPVSDQVARHAIRVAVGDAVAPGRHPAYVLALSIDSGEVDVNVHPAKREVRYRQARLVHDFIALGLGRELAGEGEVEGGALPGLAVAVAPPRPGPRAVAEVLSGYARLAGDGRGGAGIDHRSGVLALPGGRHLALVADGGLAIVDLARARRAWLVRRAGSGEEHLARPLLVPVSRVVAEAAAERLEARGEALAAIGVDVRRVSPGTVSLRRVPKLLERIEPGALLAALVAVAGGEGAPAGAAELRDALLETVDLAADWRGDAEDTTRLLASLDELADVPGVRVVLDASALERLVVGAR